MEHRGSFSEQHDYDIYNFQESSRNVVELRHLDLDLGLLLFLLENFAESPAWSRLTL